METVEEKNHFIAHRSDRLIEGREIRLEHSVTCKNQDISNLVSQGKEKIKVMCEESMRDEQKAFEIVKAAAKEWEKQAAVTQQYEQALEYLDTPEVKHTANQWIKRLSGTGEEISNRVYKMKVWIRERRNLDCLTRDKNPTVWYVSWQVTMNSPVEKPEGPTVIDGRIKMRYMDRNEAYEYLEGQKTAYAQFFREISPPIPKEYENLFSVNGVLLPGYTVEEEEPRQKKQTVDELSVEKSVVVTKESRKPVLEKLALANESSAESPKISGRKKEDISR